MKIVIVICIVRFWFVFMLSVIFGMGVMVVDIYFVDVEEIVCMIVDVEVYYVVEIGDIENDDSEQCLVYKYYIYSCGLCYLYMVGMNSLIFFYVLLVILGFCFGVDQYVLCVGFYGFYCFLCV